MTAFLYYVPGQQVDPREGKLAYAFETKPVGRGCEKGPDGAKGTVYLDSHAEPGKCGYYPDRQEWTEVPYLGCWIGQYKEDRPKEADLRRGKMLQGKALSWRGQDWMIPIARSFDEIDGEVVHYSRLSSYFTINYKTGEWDVGQVQEEYRPLWEAALRYWDAFRGESADLNPTEHVNLAVLTLSANYRIGKAEVSLLQLLSSETCGQILRILIDLDSMDELLKKNPSLVESSDTGSGKQEETEATPQLSSTG